jgi:hypothetical protein
VIAADYDLCAICGEKCKVAVAVGNSGTITSLSNVSMFFEQWGVNFGRSETQVPSHAWQQQTASERHSGHIDRRWNYIGSQMITIPAGTRSPPDGIKALFKIEPASKYRSHLCLRANLVPVLGGNIRETVSMSLHHS